ncbi:MULTISPECIES: B12-binding domain-containing radical SAM protein [unclassified Bradyrhizobium]|uniref:B12-binding domain-containing radical SAM protein n=1 Tax=unclassified Bradyrhizobium TaxID=2631580 RepID=UPI00291646E7|nr:MULTISPECIES: radical SAM protein [unclassified Bradyrhizobium]
MQITLVDNFFYVRRLGRVHVETSPHLGLMTLATILERAGHNVRIIDPKELFETRDSASPDEDFLEAWAQEILRCDPSIVGFTALGRTLPYCVGVARRLKAAAPHSPIVIGGPHATIVGERLLEKFDCFDVVVRYEAEPLILDLVRNLQSGASLDGIPNLLFRRDSSIVRTRHSLEIPEMDDLPPPAMHLYDISDTMMAELSLEAGRGCPFSCTFCSTATFFKRRYRLKSNYRLIADMEDMRGRYGVSRFILNHDLFGLNKKSLREFCRLITGRGFTWKCSMRPDTLDRSLLDQMVAAGCVDIYFGVETGSERLQSVIKKRLDLSFARRTLSTVAAMGVTCTASFITGFPEESIEDQDATLNLIGDLLAEAPDKITAQLHILSPEPGSELAIDPAAIAFDGLGPELDDLFDARLVEQEPELFSVFYHFKTTLPRWRILLSSAFVSYVLPELGIPLATHMSRTLFGGSLATMFTAIVPIDPGTVTSFSDAIAKLWQGIECMVARHAAGKPNLIDLVRLSRILALARADAVRGQGTLAGEIDDPQTCYLLVKFDCSILEGVKALLGGQSNAPADDFERIESWSLIALAEDNDVTVVPVSAQQAGEMVALSATCGETDHLSSRSLRQLGVLAVFWMTAKEVGYGSFFGSRAEFAGERAAN